MSILIKGMEMPTDSFIRIILYPNGQAVKANAVDYEEFEAIPVPPHGRLIDVNALCVTAIDITDLPVGECLMVYLKEDIDNAPTIIEAEEGE